MTAVSYEATDPTVLMRLAGDRATFRALAHTFIEHAPVLFHHLVDALQRCDYPAIGQQSHALKGMTTLVGAARLSALLQALELAARARRGADANDLGRQFMQVLAEVNACVDDASIVA